MGKIKMKFNKGGKYIIDKTGKIIRAVKEAVTQKKKKEKDIANEEDNKKDDEVS